MSTSVTPSEEIVKSRVHAIAGSFSLTLITLFFTSSVVVELAGDHGAIATVKQWILYGVAVLIPSMMITGGTGRAMIGRRRAPVLRGKQRRMIAAAVIGITILIPCAIILQRLAAAGDFGATFSVIQGIELAGGAVNITLLALNVRSGMLLTGRIRRRKPSKVSVA
jgi:hypothetical protein